MSPPRHVLVGSNTDQRAIDVHPSCDEPMSFTAAARSVRFPLG
jgi:hypothetical protein